MLSVYDRLVALPKHKRDAILDTLGAKTMEVAREQWRCIARPEQLAPGTDGAAIDREDWDFWLALAGRGWGKSRTGAEFICEKAEQIPGGHFAIVGATSADTRDTMISYGHEGTEGAAGILAISRPDFRPLYEPSKRLLTWPNGSTGTAYSAEEPDRLRGPQHHGFWADELAAWKRLRETWDMLMMGNRLGANPQGCITTTPRPLDVVKELLANSRTATARGSTYDNRANLAPAFFNTIISRYEGTRLGRQELLAELLEDVPGALWTLAMIDAARVAEAPELTRIVVAVDPAVTSTETSDETGIVVVGVGKDGDGYVLADHSGKYSPNGWASEAVALYNRWKADRVVAEVNNGGDLVEAAVRTVDQSVPYKAVHASRGKRVRAEPVAALYEQGKVHHCGIVQSNGHRHGALVKLEDQQCSWDPTGKGKSPDRVDALVWGITELMLGDAPATITGYKPAQQSPMRSARRHM